MAAATDISNYAKCHKAIQLVCHQAGPCVDSVLQSWHHNKSQLIPHCSRPRPRPPSNPKACSDRGKPKPSFSCQNCVQWGVAVEAEYYPPNLKGSIAWNNVNPSVLSSHYMEVAKAFVLRLHTNYTSAKSTDFDSASFLKFMMHFGEFHQRDRVSFDLIKKVSNIRNTLSHMKLNENLSLTNQEVSDYFDNIRDMVSCLEILHPQEFTKKYADDIRSSLTDILQSPVTERIKQEVLKPYTDAMKMTVISTLEDQFNEHSQLLTTSVKQDLKEHSDTVTTVLTQQTDVQTQRLAETTEKAVGRLRDDIHCIESKIADVEEVQRTLTDHVEECLTQQSVPVKDEGPLDVARCRKQLMLEYRSTRDKIPLLPGMPEEFASMEDLYVDLELSAIQKHLSRVTEKKLESPHGLCDMKDKRGNILKRVLVKGRPGSGKTMLVSRLAYDWATRGLQNTKCDLLFALDLREVTEDMDLIDVIQDQLLPKVSKPQLLEYIESNANSIIYLLDAFDELTNTKLGTDLTAMLSNRWLQESLIIITTRPHKCHDFCILFGMYTFVNIMNFSFQRICEFVVKFFNIDRSLYLPYIVKKVEQETEGTWCIFSESLRHFQPEKTVTEAISLLTLLKTHEKCQILSEIPITLTMLCLLWKDNGDATLPETMTTLFKKCMSYMAEHNEVKTLKEPDLDYEVVEEKLEEIMKQLGEIALKGLLQNKLVFSGKDFNASILSEAWRLGLLTKEKKRSKLRQVDMITFMHKSFQEFCAARYLVHLIEAHRDEFMTIVKQITEENYKELVFMLQFCCGLNLMAAEILLPHVVGLSLKTPKRLGDYAYVWGHLGNTTLSIADMMMNNLGGGLVFDKAHVPLILFQEAHIPALIRFLRPLFANRELCFMLDYDEAGCHTLPYFLDCLLESPEFNILVHVESAEITFGNHFGNYIPPVKQEAEVVGSLLKCIRNLTSLKMFCHYEDNQEYSDDDGVVLKGLQQIRKLKSLTLGGYGKQNAILKLVKSLDQCESLKTLSEFILRVHKDGNAIATPGIATLISKQTTLTRLSISPVLFGLNINKPGQQLSRLGDTGLAFPYCYKNEVKAMLESINPNARMTEIILNGCHVPPECIIKFMVTLRVLEIRCPDSSWAPFNSEGLFYYINTIGQAYVCQFIESEQEMASFRFPLVALELDNGRLSDNAVHAFDNAIYFITGLEILVLGWDSLSEECFPIIATKLMCLSHLRILNLAGNHIGNSIELMCKSLENKPLESLDLTDTHLSESGADILGRYLQFWPGLVELNLSENHMGKGLQGLNRGLTNLVKLQKLRLVDSNLTDKGIAGLPLQNLAQLVELDISGKQCYGPQGVEGLFRKAHYTENLKAMLLAFKDNWVQENPFLNRCWQTCNFVELRVPPFPGEDPNNEPTVLKHSHMQRLREFVRHL